MNKIPNTLYVVGFAFGQSCQSVLLIKKTHPEWQAGLLNGVGGKINDGETSRQAMIREFKEETDLHVTNGWRLFATITDPANNRYLMDCWTVKTPFISSAVQTTDEKPQVVLVDSILNRQDVIPNLRWLVPMAIEHLDNRLITPRLEIAMQTTRRDDLRLDRPQGGRDD